MRDGPDVLRGAVPRRVVALLLLVALACGACTGLTGGSTRRGEPLSGLAPVDPQPTSERLAPGLAVRYAYAIVNSISELQGLGFEPGPPLAHLDWRMGSGIVLTSKAREGVGARISGLIRFATPGIYGFDVTSNDGVRLEIGGKLIHEDPLVHPDTTSRRVDVRIDAGGWYPIEIVYFQKRYTATLVVRWAPPGEARRLTPVPADALAHGTP